jgi:hypothetical protein
MVFYRKFPFVFLVLYISFFLILFLDPFLILYSLLMLLFILIFIVFYGLIFKFGSILLRNFVDDFITDIIIPEYEKHKQKGESEEETTVINLVWRVW